MVTEFFATVDVADVHLHDGGIECDQSVTQRNGGMRVPTGIDDDARDSSPPGLVDPIDQLALVVRLPCLDHRSELRGRRFTAGNDVVQRVSPVELRLALAQQIQVGPVEDQDR